jgi:hypothetical protein
MESSSLGLFVVAAVLLAVTAVGAAAFSGHGRK